MLLQTLAWQPRSGWSAPLAASMDSPSTLAVIFGGRASEDTARGVAEVAAQLPNSVLMGCSTAGEIHGDHVKDASLSVAIASFEGVSLRKVVSPIDNPIEAYAVGRDLGRALSSPGLRAVFVLSDGLNVNGSRLTTGLTEVLPRDVVVTGGLAGDGERFGSTWVVGDRAPRDRCVAAVGFYGERLRVGHGCHAGWSSFGPERTITRADGNVLYELDNKPALALYKTYLGERATGLPATALLFPLAVWEPGGGTTPLIRTILGVDEATQSLTFAGDIPQGHRARLMRTNIESLIQSAGLAGARAAQEFPESGSPLSIAVSCVGRRLVLGERTEEEIESVLEALPRGAAQVGFYSYGELSPRSRGGVCDLHNQTMTVTLLDER
ncbi:MAG: FIST N-terminal domain-containing protein [Burkholderiales bacterium]